jgi:predicted nucleotidyltransferase
MQYVNRVCLFKLLGLTVQDEASPESDIAIEFVDFTVKLNPALSGCGQGVDFPKR